MSHGELVLMATRMACAILIGVAVGGHAGRNEWKPIAFVPFVITLILINFVFWELLGRAAGVH